MKYLRRFLWYLTTRLSVIVLILGLMVIAFYYAMNLTNIQVVLKDGMARRAITVMQTAGTSELTKYFQQSFIDNDVVLQTLQQGTSPYRDYNIRGIDHRLEMGFFWCWPWDDTVRLEIVERIPSIDGRIKGNKAEEAVAARGPNAVYPPRWQSGRYRVVLVREMGQWRIRSLTMLEILE